MGMDLQMDLYGTEVEMAELSETQGWIGYLRKMRMQFDEPHHAEGSKHTHDEEFFSVYLQTQVDVIYVTRT